MHKLVSLHAALLLFFVAAGQTPVPRPKLVIGIVTDQMRWDYLYRYYDRYTDNSGFKRLLKQGFSCENTLIPYTPTVTACGHTGIYTGSVPAIHGITGNSWWDNQLNKSMYCVEDKTVKTVGSNTELGQMSPRNLLTTTVCDELRLATNFQSKVIGVALKDRGSILPAGHSANAAYWYDGKTGGWISSSYYMQSLPQWVKDFNAKKMVDKYYEKGWNPLYPLNDYDQSATAAKAFSYSLKQYTGKNYEIISATPYGNSFTIQMAQAALTAEHLGEDSVTDFLALSLSSPDYIGHSFGPNSIETEDNYLRLDKDLGDFLNFLDEKVGKGQYLVFLTADHGTAHVPGFLKQHNIPAGNVDTQTMFDEMNKLLQQKFGADNLVADISNYQVYLDHAVIKNDSLDAKEIRKWVIDYILKQPGIARAFELDAFAATTLNTKVKDMITNGYYATRSGDIQLIFQPQWIEGFENGGTTHGLWNPYDAHIPLLWYGWNIKQGTSNREINMTDIAPTIAALLHIQMPSGCVGHVIEEITK